MERFHASKSFRDFLKQSDNRVARVLSKLCDRQREWRMFSNTITTAEVNYLTFRRDGTISYLPNGKELKFNDDGEWARDGRQNGKPAKVVRKLFTERMLKFFKEADFESFANEYKSNFNDEGYVFLMRDRGEIKDVYDMDRARGDASLNGSCMNGDSNYLDMYEACESLRILIMVDKDQLLCGRALVWNLKYNDEDIVFMDRVYVTQDFMYEKFVQYATENNMWRKKYYKTFDYKQQFVKPDGEEVATKFTVLTNTDHDRYPYIDTFCYGDDGELNNYGGTYTYNDTGGERSGDDHEDEIWDEHRHEYIHEDDAVSVDRGYYRGYYIHVDDSVECANGYIWWNGDDRLQMVGDHYYDKESGDIEYVPNQDEWFLTEDTVYCESLGESILREEAYEVDGKIYHEDEVVKL